MADRAQDEQPEKLGPDGDIRAASSGSEEQPIKDAQQPSLAQEHEPTEKKPSKLKQAWEKVGLDFMTVSLMFKGSLPPVIAIAMYQSHAVASEYGTQGYLVAIASILGFCIMPRGKFIQHMSLAVFAICLAAAINLLALFCAVKARQHTTPPGHRPVGYNASASAICALWLCVQVYLINVIRTARPQFQLPSIICSIFTIVSMTYGTQFPDMSSSMAFMKQLLVAFLTGFGLATATHVLIFPTSSRKVVFKEFTGYLSIMNGIMKVQTAYMASLETHDPLKPREVPVDDGKKKRDKKDKKKTSDDIFATPASAKLKELMGKLFELQSKLHGDITPAKREIAIGKLESHDLTEIWKLARTIFLPVMGLCSMLNILERRAELCGWKKVGDVSDEVQEERHHQVDNLQDSMKFLHKPFAEMTATLDGAFTHILLTLELVKPPKKQKQPDEENKGDGPPPPGSPGFAEDYKRKIDEFYNSKRKSLEDWCNDHGITLPPDFFESSFIHPQNISMEQEHIGERHQRQIFFILYLEYLLWRVAKAVLNLVLYVDKRKQEGAFKRSKVIFPGSKTLYKWLKATFGKEDLSHEDSFTVDMDSGGAEALYLGESFVGKRKDPEHEQPRNALERFGESIRVIPRFFRSEESAFGLRVVAATMTLAIVCYLRDTQKFFLENRLLWAEIMTAISMSRTSGQSAFNYVLRVFGTVIAMIASYVIWYIVDGKTPGILVFLWIWIMIAFYPVLKTPKYLIISILGIVTSVLIVGYELQVRVIGIKASESNGQPAYPLYILAPYRLATVVCGIVVAFIWTIFPFPISESTELRKDLAVSLNLMSAFYENVHETINARITGRAGSISKKGTHAYNLDKARITIFSKLVFIIQTLKTNSAFSKFQVHIGGRFPHEEYEALIDCINRLMLWFSLASYASVEFESQTTGSSLQHNLWAAEFGKTIANTSHIGHQITSLLSLLASSLSNGQPLPPYLQIPQTMRLVDSIDRVNHDLVSIRHIAEPEYSAFAVMQVATQCINTDIRKLVGHVKNLVGEIDFSYRAVKSSSASTLMGSGNDSDDDEKTKAE